MVERRNKKRKTPGQAWRVFNRQTRDFLGHVSNISSEGLMLRSESPVAIDVLLNLRIVLPMAINGNLELECDAVSLWCDRGSNPRFYNTGMQLLNLSEEDSRTIEKLIEYSPA